ncbi:MAG: hypothetical protein U0414_35750 [Polyangiaceae bacterium]
MVSRGGDHQVTVQIGFEELELTPKPFAAAGACVAPVSFQGRRLEVVDVDTSVSPPVWLKPVDLDDAYIAMQHGLEPSEGDPQFHQQMVYAVATRTLEQFDRALGRTMLFRGRHRLRLVPHAFRGANAFYHPGLRAVLFGYFRASEESPGENLPGQIIFTCASHDIIAHEVTHAIVDRLRPHFNVATNEHVRAFHEAFADIVAVFQRLTYRDLVHRALQDAKGLLKDSAALANIAAQFGQGLGNTGALRSALEQSADKRTKLRDVNEEHEMGAVLVAAVYEGFQRTYERRTADLIRIATGGTGVLPQGALHPDLVARLTAECVRTAQSVLTMCIRAFDYLPPADVTFGAFLRALVTADWELNPLDESGLRASLIEACRLRGIFAAEAGSLAVSALLLDEAPCEPWANHRETFAGWVDLALAMNSAEQRDATPEDPDEAAPAPRDDQPFAQRPVVSASGAFAEASDVGVTRKLAHEIEAWLRQASPVELGLLGITHAQTADVVGFHASHRVASDGTLRFGLVVQFVEVDELVVDGATVKFPRGTTMVLDVTGKVRFLIRSAGSSDRQRELASMAARAHVNALGWHAHGMDLGRPQGDPFAVDYRGMHEGRSA